MSEIGGLLREARIRQSIDISAVEAATKIRAKYLRALENEEFEVLPEAAYVKTFIRTYAEHLGLDGRQLVQAYKDRYERNEQPTFGHRPEVKNRVRRPGPPLAVLILIGLGIALLLLLLILGLTGNSGG